MSEWGVGDVLIFLCGIGLALFGIIRIIFAGPIDAARLARQVDDGTGYSAKSPMDARTSGFIMLGIGVLSTARSLFL